jgi:DNA-binding LacI/PurR family transcriptional regulator
MMGKKQNRRKKQTTLKTLAEHLDLAPGTVSKVLNNANGSEAISQITKTRILAAARKFRYRPNFLARSLRTKRTYMIGVLVLEIGDSANGLVMAGIERFLRQRGYVFTTGVHRNSPEMLSAYGGLFQRRGVEGLITVDAEFPYRSALPTVAITIPPEWTRESLAAASADSVSLANGSVPSRRFLERVGESAAEALLAQIEPEGEDILAFGCDPGLTVHDFAGSTLTV